MGIFRRKKTFKIRDIEFWLLGNTIPIQKEYWDVLKESKWNKGREEMPKYSILEAVIEGKPGFNNLPLLAEKLEMLIR